MRKITNYLIISERMPEKLGPKVNDAIKRGWQPYGNVFTQINVIEQIQTNWVSQTMVIYEEEEKRK